MQPTVLLIEDDPDLSSMYIERLSRGGLTVIHLANGTAALTKLQSQQPWPDAIILDLMLPGTSGFEILRHIAEDKRRTITPIIICTAFADEERQRQAEALGFHDYYLKTQLTPGDLTNLVNERLRSVGQSESR